MSTLVKSSPRQQWRDFHKNYALIPHYFQITTTSLTVFYNPFDFLQSFLNLKQHSYCKSVHELLSLLGFSSDQLDIKQQFVLQTSR